ncbi:Aste57867_4568 [Aphanomyces stellatus]|uniref:Aste57867_4568 protein n=1 Tax=Aphanomyces stellatus TaxID=120398 RepID=A0A485KFM1_9STRA|nr:hypothetical protein As57867_004555 [Aphanomyces stellatus]VFT81674.1 Aste57867_4568 [Aphanomyces stellatus]
MTAPADAQPPDPRRRRAVIETLTKRLDAHDRDNLDQPIMAIQVVRSHENHEPDQVAWSRRFVCWVLPGSTRDILGALAIGVQLSTQPSRSPSTPPTSQCGGSLHKSGDRGDPGIYRPISLMPVEVKVLSRALPFVSPS